MKNGARSGRRSTYSTLELSGYLHVGSPSPAAVTSGLVVLTPIPQLKFASWLCVFVASQAPANVAIVGLRPPAAALVVEHQFELISEGQHLREQVVVVCAGPAMKHEQARRFLRSILRPVKRYLGGGSVPEFARRGDGRWRHGDEDKRNPRNAKPRSEGFQFSELETGCWILDVSSIQLPVSSVSNYLQAGSPSAAVATTVFGVLMPIPHVVPTSCVCAFVADHMPAPTVMVGATVPVEF